MSDEPAKFFLGDTAISAVEEHSGGKRGFFRRRGRPRRRLTHCENCGAELTGKYCAQCGQPAIDYRRSFRHVLVDVLDSFLNWDSKFFATIGLLIAKPWRLTNEFLGGRRVRYVHPLRLYLLASILFFFAVNYWAKSLHIDPGHLTPEARAEIEADLKKENLTPKQRKRVERALKIADLPPDLASQMGAKVNEQKAKPNNVSPAATGSPEASAAPEANAPAQAQATGSPEESPKKQKTEEDYGPLLKFGPDSSAPSNDFEKWLEARAKQKLGEHGTNAQLFIITVISNLPYMMLCCIPLFAFVLKILYIRKHTFYIDHLVYALHIHTFVYVSVITIGLATMGLFRVVPHLLAGWIVGLLWLAFAVQIFLSIRRVYRQGWFFSTFKFFVGGFVYLIVLFVALAATFFITLALP
ncbi:MAG: hypothetical protein QOE73_2203 [Verrucomicrobiota bacterium]